MYNNGSWGIDKQPYVRNPALEVLGIPSDTDNTRLPILEFRYTGRTGDDSVRGEIQVTWETWPDYHKVTRSGPICEFKSTNMSKTVVDPRYPHNAPSGSVEGVISRTKGYENWKPEEVDTCDKSTASSMSKGCYRMFRRWLICTVGQTSDKETELTQGNTTEPSSGLHLAGLSKNLSSQNTNAGLGSQKGSGWSKRTKKWCQRLSRSRLR